MRYKPTRKTARRRAIKKARVTDRKFFRSKRPLFPTSPIIPKAGKNVRNLVKLKPGFSDRFEKIEDVRTPFARACVIEAAQQAREPYALRNDFDYSLGSFSIKPAAKNRIASDGGDEDGNEVVKTEKVVRTSAGVIVSTDDSDDNRENYIVANARYVFEQDDFERIIDTEITELALQPAPLDGPNKTPTIVGLLIYPGHGTPDGEFSDGWSIQTLLEIGEPSYQVHSNNNIVLVADAYSYIDNDGTRVDGDLSYTWKFTADGMGKAMNSVVGNGKILRIYNIQLAQRGRYTCEITNEKGVSYTKAMFINPIGGLLQELDENGLAIGTYIRDTDHDNKYSQYDPYWDYDHEFKRWFRAEYIGNKWVESANQRKTIKTSQRASQYNTAESPIMVSEVPGKQARHGH
jgi:hypothetical protein